VLVVVRRGDELLVLHRSPAQGGYWHCVAGALEPGESFAQAAARELAEETGLRGVEVGALGVRFAYPVGEEPQRVYAGGAKEVTVECFAAEAPPGWEPTLDWEHDDYRWCSADEAIELLHWPEPREVVKALA
jgi:dATP pyrophosphohydrolase